MAKTRKSIQRKNLARYDVLIEDTSPTSEYFQVTNLPPVFAGGRNSFLLAGTSVLAPGSIIQIEILDSDGNPIFQNPVQQYLEGNSRLISVEINETTMSGFATIILLGRASRYLDGRPVPPDWESTYNVRWTRRILVEPNRTNSSAIILQDVPTVLAEEQRFFAVDTSSYVTNITAFTASLSPLLYSAIQIGYLIKAEAPTSFSAELLNGYITGSADIDDVNTNIYIPITEILNDTTAFSTGQLINAGNTLIDRLYLTSGSYETEIRGRQSSVTASVSLVYDTLEVSNIQNPLSYAKLRVVNLNTVSGEIRALRVSSKVSTNLSDFVVVADVPTVTTEVLVSQSIYGDTAIGDFFRSPIATDSWYADGLEPSSNVLYPTSGSSEYYDSSLSVQTIPVEVTDDILLRSLRAKVPVLGNTFQAPFSETGYFIGTTAPVEVFPTTEYTLQLDAVYRLQSASTVLTGETPTAHIYIIGVDGTTIVDRNPLGQKIGTLVVDGNAEIQRYKSRQFNFVPQIPGSGSVGLRLVVTNGFWYFSNISLKPASDEIFSPDEATIIIPNTQFKNDFLEHKIQFLDVNNNSTATQAISNPTYFTGSSIDLGVIR
jgi:hypothetical protein